MFDNEKSLVDSFIDSLETIPSPWGELKLGSEFFYQRGRTDLVAVSNNGKVIAFEAKLKKWRIALQQAYRNRCFADFSYVLLPTYSANLAYKNLDEFILRGVGICCVSEDGFEILHEALLTEPIQPWLREQAFMYASSGGVY